ncbi:MAG: hypothetical protein F4X99_22780 [Gammaproteobacteria bacterium]|nr:hypothetical protein [Gammaproteobacteria bacterium]MYE84424.1 hypothetical protein [Gammaproteobacteria bacterium]
MAQPVMDTLQVADALRRSGMEREQAEGVARTLGRELSEHVAAHKDLELGFAGIRAHVDERFAEIKGEIKALDTKFNVLGAGMALALAYLAVLASLDRFL